MIRFSLILIFFLTIFYLVLAEDDEFYCLVKKDNWQVCRRCNETDNDCDGTSKDTDKCRCDDIKLVDPRSGKSLFGGWETCQKEGWCFVLYRDPPRPGTCSDQDDDWYNDSEKLSPLKSSRNGLSYIWLKNGPWEGVSKSKQACDGRQYNTGNEPVLEGVRITQDRLQNVQTNGLLEKNDLEFYYDNSEDCKEECHSRTGTCGAWSFDKENFICYLHTVDSCCGQFGKRENNVNFISGYICRHCWSTKAETECPCSIKERTKKPDLAHSSGAKQPLHNAATGLIRVDGTKINPDLCKCEYRTFPRRPFCRCVQPLCDSRLGGAGECDDARRCRVRPINSKRFPLGC